MPTDWVLKKEEIHQAVLWIFNDEFQAEKL